MTGKDTDNDFILIDDLIADASEDGTPQRTPPPPPVQMPLPQAEAPPNPARGGQQPGARTPIPPTKHVKTEAPRHATPRTPPAGIGRESKMAAVVGVLLILMAAGMYLYYSPPSQEAPPSVPAPRKFSVQAAPPMATPTPDHQPPLQAPAITAGGEMDTDAGPPPMEAPAAPPDDMAMEKSVTDFLSVWRDAWEKSAGPNGALGPYLACYAPEFRHNGMDKNAWAADKTNKNRRKDWIGVRISDILVNTQLDNDTLRVTFFQEYTSSNYRDASLKTLFLKKTGNSWQIIAAQ